MSQTQAIGTIQWLAEELRDQVFYVSDDELRSEILGWLRRTSQLPAADLDSHVEDRLSSVRREEDAEGMGQYAMRRVSEDGTEDFPDSCKGCKHYGVRCPVFSDPVERRELDRLQEEDVASDAERRQAYRRFAETNECHQIAEALDEWSNERREHAVAGWDLYERTDVDLGRTDETEEARESVEEALEEVEI